MPKLRPSSNAHRDELHAGKSQRKVFVQVGTAAMSARLLPFQERVIEELRDEDGLVVVGHGLGGFSLLVEFVDRVAFREHVGDSVVGVQLPLVLGLNINLAMVELAKRCMTAPGATPRFINHDYSTAERKEVYATGGFLAISSVILQRDLLTSTLQPGQITGFVVWDAHMLDDARPETFILRLYRDRNKSGFIKAFSENPSLLNTGFHGAEKVLRKLYLRRLFLWPRFHEAVQADLQGRDAVEVVELHQPLSDSMATMQTCIVACINNCLKEVRKTSKNNVDLSDFKTTESLFGAFDDQVKRQLEPIWHFATGRTRGLVGELKTLRRLLWGLTQLNSVDFYALLENIRSAEGIQASWLVTREASKLYMLAKSRVYGMKSSGKRPLGQNGSEMEKEMVPVLEQPPKWALLTQILNEIRDESVAAARPGKVLIVVKHSKTVKEIQNCVSAERRKAMMLDLLSQFVKHQPVPVRQAYGKYRAKREELEKSNQISLTQLIREDEIELVGTESGESDRDATANINDAEVHVREDGNFMQSTFQFPGNAGKDLKISVAIYSHVPGVAAHALDEFAPEYIVMYEGDLSFIREVECYSARVESRAVRVYFMVYEKSPEETRYVKAVERERKAFETLIREKASMMVLADQEGRNTTPALEEDLDSQRVSVPQALRGLGPARDTRQRQTAPTVSENAQIVLDTRELRSSLPNILHLSKIRLLPVTLEVGDFVLSPRICVERKSLPDLTGSLNSGRLYNQVEAMSRYYPESCLLIECEHSKPMTISTGKDLDLPLTIASTMSKLVLLTLTFPKLRLLWCKGPRDTVKLFTSLKANEPEPSVEEASSLGLDTAMNSSEYNDGPMAILRTLPGIDSKNISRVVDNVKNLSALVQKTQEQLESLLGSAVNAKALFRFLHMDPPSS